MARRGLILAAALALASTHAQAAGPAPLSAFKDCSFCGEMAVIPAGAFDMGESLEQGKREPETPDLIGQQGPVHRVSVPTFALARYPVTREQFSQFVDATGYQAKGCVVTAWNGESTRRRQAPEASWEDPGFAQTDHDPVVCMAWEDAVAYVDWLAAKTGKPYRLPSEAEVEYAARAGTTTSRFWGDDPATQCKSANGADLTARKAFPDWTDRGDLGVGHVASCSDGFAHTSPVGAFAANPWGLFDMLGNVAVWTADCWHPTYAGAPIDGADWYEEQCDRHVLRGGGWVYEPGTPHASWRQGAPLHDREDYVGVRVARSLP